ncbi:MAG TPA: hypothetical protein VK629_21865 [Steroidobacteraceae bacterium]|nr:hypothetical protein [Steroidobacteraceae bacterium]
MSSRFDDYLWDPQTPSDPEIAAFERILAPSSARSRGLTEHAIAVRKGKRWLIRTVAGTSIISMCVALFAAYYVYRLDWRDSSPWRAVTLNDSAQVKAGTRTEWAVGESLVTQAGQTSTVNVARIGTLTISENSELQLLLTRKDRHRVELTYGHVHAKIWAPPAYFGIESGATSVIDMGCEFDLRIDRDRIGSLSVTSGWVIYRAGETELSMPAGYAVNFDADSAELPFRQDVSDALRTRVAELEVLLANNAPVDAAAAAIAQMARQDDYYTLLQLLIRYPTLADGPLYSALGIALSAPQSPDHRKRWAEGERSARNEWWRLLPTQPKTWWVNWRDAF